MAINQQQVWTEDISDDAGCDVTLKRGINISNSSNNQYLENESLENENLETWNWSQGTILSDASLTTSIFFNELFSTEDF